MIKENYTITAPQGLHARPATTLIRLTKNYQSAVSLQKGEKIIRLNSMLNVLSLMIKGGDSIAVIIEGEDETEAARAIDIFFKQELQNHL